MFRKKWFYVRINKLIEINTQQSKGKRNNSEFSVEAWFNKPSFLHFLQTLKIFTERKIIWWGKTKHAPLIAPGENFRTLSPTSEKNSYKLKWVKYWILIGQHLSAHCFIVSIEKTSKAEWNAAENRALRILHLWLDRAGLSGSPCCQGVELQSGSTCWWTFVSEFKKRHWLRFTLDDKNS